MKMVDLCTSQPFLPDFDKSFPPAGFDYKKVALDSLHAKQMCWEENGGSFGAIMQEVTEQLEQHLMDDREPSLVASKEEAVAVTR